MDCLYYIEKEKSALFHECIIDGYNKSLILYSFDVNRKTDPLLITFLNHFSEQDFDRRRIPEVFLKMLLHFKESNMVIKEWESGSLNAEFVSWWITSDAWKENWPGAKVHNDVTLFFLKSILETVLSPILRSSRETTAAQNIIETVMMTDWRVQKVYWSNSQIYPQNAYLNLMHVKMVEYSALWHFINHQATFNCDHNYGLFPEKKVRYFSRSYLGIHFDLNKVDPFMEAVKYSDNYRGPFYDPSAHYPEMMNSETKWKRYYSENSLTVLKNIRDPQGFCVGFDKEYYDYERLGDYYTASNLLELICLTLLQFSIYGIPIRRCTLCGRFYIPIKNPTSDHNFCHRRLNDSTEKTCSMFHSHNQKSFVRSNDSNSAHRYERTVKSFRSTLSQSPLYEIEDGKKWIYLMREALVVIQTTVKNDQSQLENCETIIKNLKEMHMRLRRIDSCPKLEGCTIDARDDTIQNVILVLNRAERLIKED